MLTKLGKRYLKEVDGNLILIPKNFAENNLSEFVLNRSSKLDDSGYYYDKDKTLVMVVIELPILFCTSEYYYSKVVYDLLTTCREYMDDKNITVKDVYYLLIENRSKIIEEGK